MYERPVTPSSVSRSIKIRGIRVSAAWLVPRMKLGWISTGVVRMARAVRVGKGASGGRAGMRGSWQEPHYTEGWAVFPRVLEALTALAHINVWAGTPGPKGAIEDPVKVASSRALRP